MESCSGSRNLSRSSTSESKNAQRVDIAQCAFYQPATFIKYTHICVALDDDAVHSSWTVCDERFGAVAQYNKGLGLMDTHDCDREREREREHEKDRDRDGDRYSVRDRDERGQYGDRTGKG